MKNVFTQTGISLSLHEINEVEQAIGIGLPAEVRAFYREYNGGRPKFPTWFEDEEELLSLKPFFPMKYSDSYGQTVEGVYRKGLADGYLKTGMIPFTADDGGNFVCFDQHGAVFQFLMDQWRDELTKEQNQIRNLAKLQDSFFSFVDGLRKDRE